MGEKMEWISVKDRLPTPEEWNISVLAYLRSGTCRVSSYSPRAGGFWFDVTHWMPLPDPPKHQRCIGDTSPIEPPIYCMCRGLPPKPECPVCNPEKVEQEIKEKPRKRSEEE